MNDQNSSSYYQLTSKYLNAKIIVHSKLLVTQFQRMLNTNVIFYKKIHWKQSPIITSSERLLFCEQFPEQNCKAVDVVFNSSRVVDVDPDFRRYMCHSSSTITTTVGIRLWIVFPFSQSEVTHLWQTCEYIHGIQKKKRFFGYIFVNLHPSKQTLARCCMLKKTTHEMGQDSVRLCDGSH